MQLIHVRRIDNQGLQLKDIIGMIYFDILASQVNISHHRRIYIGRQMKLMGDFFTTI
jgi:hypothetical protein